MCTKLLQVGKISVVTVIHDFGFELSWISFVSIKFVAMGITN